MLFILRKAIKFLRRAGGKLASSARKSVLRVSLAGLRFGPGAHLSRLTQITTLDGGRITLGAQVHLAEGARLACRAGQITIGARSFVGVGSILTARDSIQIGVDCQIAEYVSIRDQDHRTGTGQPLAQSEFDTAPIRIGNNVWIGAGAVILKGVSIGDNAVIGARAVVTRDVPADTTVVGVPARALSRRNSL